MVSWNSGICYGGPDRKDEQMELNWIKSSKSSGNGNCVEVAQLPGGGVAVRDSKDPEGPQLRFTEAEWDAFLYGAHRYEFNF